MRLLERWLEKYRAYSAEHGFTCDGCGVELFVYPVRRFCDECQSKLYKNNKKTCEKCGRQTVADGVCLSCKKSKPQFTKGLSPFVYRGLVCSLINRFKTGSRYLSYYFAEEIVEYLFENLPTMSALNNFTTQNASPVSEIGEDCILLLPVPMTKKDKRERGFNQAEELAKRVREQLEKRNVAVELDCEVLLKVKQTLPQKQRPFFERAENLAGAFHVHKRKKCKNRRIFLIDDIMTTGATASECASRLLGAGAREVVFLSIGALSEQK